MQFQAHKKVISQKKRRKNSTMTLILSYFMDAWASILKKPTGPAEGQAWDGWGWRAQEHRRSGTKRQ